MQLRKDDLKLKLIWRSKDWNRKNLEIALFMNLIENSNLKDSNFIKRINGLISLTEKRLTCVENFT